MLSAEDNLLLTRVGPGTPMGDLLRQYWLPAVYGDEIEPDGRPYRLRLLGEDLVAFRDSSGRPGLLAHNCPHRGASLFFGRNEEDGLRCVYHGWKFDVTGRCVDMPNEPAESTSLPGPLPYEGRGSFKDKVRAVAYPCREAGGIIWAYLGARQKPPELPRLEWLLVPSEQHRHAWRAIRECNWAQAMEGDLDSSHAPFLHGVLSTATPFAGGRYRNQDKAPRLEVVETDYGIVYGARRDEGPEHYYWRTTQFMFPFFTCFPATLDGEVPCHMWVPIDDERTMIWLESWRPLRPFTQEERAGRAPDGPNSTELYWPNNGVGEFTPPAGGQPYAGWWAALNQDNDFGVDRELQRTRTYTGIPTVPLQDAAMTVSMGRIADREIEHLGTADAAIIRVRRRLLQAVRALHELGIVPPGVDRPEIYRVRSASAVLRRDLSWQDALRGWHAAEAGLPAEDESARFVGR